MNSILHDFDDELLAALAEERPATTQLVSVHRPTFSQQLTVLRGDMPGLGQGAATFRPDRVQCAIRALEIPA